MARLTKKLRTAAAHYLRLKTRLAHPVGKFDNARRWYPAESEEGDCCTAIRRPSREYPYSLLTHCRSIGHVAASYGYTPEQLRWAIKRLEDEWQPPSPEERLATALCKSPPVAIDYVETWGQCLACGKAGQWKKLNGVIVAWSETCGGPDTSVYCEDCFEDLVGPEPATWYESLGEEG